MGFSFYQLFGIAVGYLLALFLVAWVTDRGVLPARLVRHPVVYVLSLGVFCSAWATSRRLPALKATATASPVASWIDAPVAKPSHTISTPLGLPIE